MMFHRSRIKCEKRTITICDNSLTYLKNTKFVGLIIDDKLNWPHLILYMKNKLSKSIGIIHKTRYFIYKHFKKTLFYFHISLSNLLY